MSATMIVYVRITDPERFTHYTEAVADLFARHGAHPVAHGVPVVLESEWPWQGMAVFEWPSRAAAEAVWNSPEYAEVKRLRQGAAEFQAVVIEAPPPPPAGA